MSEWQSCPCGSGNTLEKCCAPYLSGERQAPTAEALMRSRYTAYVLHDDAYLRRTWLASTQPPADESPSEDEGLTWTGLTIVRAAAGGENDKEGLVEFIAHCEVNGEPGHLHEISHFRRVDGHWLYVDGERGDETAQGAPQPQRRAEPKVGRNDPCPCGSGKKYKKCCGA